MSRADFLLSPEELRARQMRRRRLLLRGVALLLLLVLAVLAARPARNAIKGWQARRHAEKAFRLIEEGKWNEARAESTAAYQLRPNEPQAIRAVGRFLSRVRQPQALEFWDQLAKQQPLSREDLRDRAGVALTLGETTVAGPAVNELLGQWDGGPKSADWLLAAQLAAQQGAGEH